MSAYHCTIDAVFLFLIKREHKSVQNCHHKTKTSIERNIPITLRKQVHVVRVRLLVYIVVTKHISDSRNRIDHDGDRFYLGPLKVVIREVELEVCEVLLNSRRGEEGEEAVDAISGVVAGEVAEEELGQLRTKGAIVRIARTILNTPCGEVRSYAYTVSTKLIKGTRYSRVKSVV